MKVSKISAVGGRNETALVEKSKDTLVKNPKSEIYRTKKIVRVQTGVIEGKKGKESVYVYEKLPTEQGFDVKKHRETVFTENLPNLRKTAEYQAYMEGLKKKKK